MKDIKVQQGFSETIPKLVKARIKLHNLTQNSTKILVVKKIYSKKEKKIDLKLNKHRA